MSWSRLLVDSTRLGTVLGGFALGVLVDFLSVSVSVSLSLSGEMESEWGRMYTHSRSPQLRQVAE